MFDRARALELLKTSGTDAALMQHALFTEAIMRALATRFGKNAEDWGVCGLLHDVDFPQTKNSPEQHGLKARDMLHGMEEEYIYAISAHNSEHTGFLPKSDLDFALRCAESVTGLIHAAALVRPDGMQGMQAKSIKKKMKDKAFAASVNREVIRQCADLDLELDEFLTLAIAALTPIATELGCAK